MLKERVDEMLKDYRHAVGRMSYLWKKISELEEAIHERESDMAEDMASVSAQVISDMPHGTTVSNPTERIGILLACGWKPDDLIDMEASLKAAQDECKKLNITVCLVEAWKSGLSERERWIIETEVIDGEVWTKVITLYEKAFGEHLSIPTLKRLKKKALDKIYKMAE